MRPAALTVKILIAPQSWPGSDDIWDFIANIDAGAQTELISKPGQQGKNYWNSFLLTIRI